MENTSRTRESISTVSSQEPELTSQARLGSSPHILCLAWKPDAPDDPSVEFAASITSYLFGSCREILVETRERELLDDLDLDELVVSIRSGRVATITFRTGRVDLAGE